MKKNIIVSFFFFFTFSLFSSPYDMIPVGDPVLDDLRFISLESGNSFLSFTPPLPPHEVEQYLDTLDVSSLSSPAREAYNRIRNRLNPQAPLTLFSSHNFAMTINIDSTIEAVAKSNENISWYPQNPRVPAFAAVPIRLYFADSLQLYIEPSLTMKKAHYTSANPLGINASADYHKNDFFMPLRAYMSAGGTWWNFQLGRDRLSYGTGHMGNLAVSDNPDFYEFLRYSFFSRYFKYSSLISQMPLEINDDLLHSNQFNGINRTTNRYFYLHRIDVNLFSRLSIGVMEGVMVGNSPLEIRYMNPLMIFHSFFSWNDYDPWDITDSSDRGSFNGSLFSVEANWNIIKSLAVYGQFVMNEFSTGDELADNPNQPPNGLGYMAGIRYSHSFNIWASSFFFEYTSTDPFLYLNPSPFASLIHMRKTPEPYYTFIGYSRDLRSFSLGGSLFKDDSLSFSALFSLHLNGERGMYYDWDISEELYNEKTPSGIAEEKIIASISSRWRINSLFALKGSLTGIFSRNNKHITGSNETGLQAALSLNFQY